MRVGRSHRRPESDVQNLIHDSGNGPGARVAFSLPEPGGGSVRRSRAWAIGILALIVVLGWLGWRARSGHAAPKYRTATVDQGDISATVSATGTVKPVVQVEVGSQVSGTVSHIFADYNS